MYSPVSARSAAAYKKASIEASVEMATPHQLTSLLFDALLRSVARAKLSMDAKDIGGKCKHIGDAIRILEEGLKAPLDLQKGGQLAANLEALYDFCILRLVNANLKNDIGFLDDVVRTLEPIISGWKQIDGNGPAYLRPV